MLGDDGIYFSNPERPEEEMSRCSKYGIIRHQLFGGKLQNGSSNRWQPSQEVNKSRNVQNPLSRPAEIGNQFSSAARIG